MTELSVDRYSVLSLVPSASDGIPADVDLLQTLEWFGLLFRCERAELKQHFFRGYETVLCWRSLHLQANPPPGFHLAPQVPNAEVITVASTPDSVLRLNFQCVSGRQWLVVFQRGPADPEFTEEEKRAASDMLGPLRGAVSLWSRLAVAQRYCSKLQDVLNTIDCGVILLGVRDDIIFINRRADIVLSANDGLVRAQNRITASDFRDAAMLQGAMNYALQHVSLRDNTTTFLAPLMSITRARGTPLSVALLPIPPVVADERSAVMALYIVDPTDDISNIVGMTCQMYGLTQAETRLATQIVAGLSLNAAARAIKIREQTARAYLRQIFSKLGVSRQAELVRILLAGVIRIHAQFISLRQ